MVRLNPGTNPGLKLKGSTYGTHCVFVAESGVSY